MTEFARHDEPIGRRPKKDVRAGHRLAVGYTIDAGPIERRGRIGAEGALRLQRWIGNVATAQLLSLQRGGGAPPAIAPLKADDVVITRSPGSVTAAAVPGFRAKLRAMVIDWGFAFNPAAVRLASEGKAIVIALRWSLGWGAKPTAVSASDDTRPVEAKLAQQAITGLPGWTSLSAADRSAVSNLIGGEINDLSDAVRTSVRATFLALRAKSAPIQATSLRALLKAGTGPDVVAEHVQVVPVSVALTGPKKLKSYGFRGLKADAESWKATYGDGPVVTIYAPKAPVTGFHNHTVQEAADAARYLPKRNRAVLKEIVLNPVTNPKDPAWAVKYHRPNFHSYMTGGATGTVTIYPDATGTASPDADYMRGTMIHETGHSLTDSKWGADTTKGKWKAWAKAMAADRVSVSAYAASSIHEDVAETIQVYGSTKATPAFAEYRAIVPSRFAILDKELK
jgi:hypothetical protein